MNKNKKIIFKLFIFALLALPIGVLFNFSQIKNQIYTAVLPSIVVSLSNQSRLSADLPSLKINTKLQKAAQLQAQNMADGSYLSATIPVDQKSWHWLDEVGYNYVSAGENIAVDLNNSSDSEVGWLNSSEQRKNILDKKYTETGIGIARGNYQGRDAAFIVQYFGKPAPLRENPLTLALAN